MSQGSAPKTKATTVSAAQSPFYGVRNYNVNMDGLGSASVNQSGNTISSSSQLAQPLQDLQNSSISGLQNNVNYLNMSPTQQMQNLQSGGNAEYNYNAAQNALQNQQQLASQQVSLGQNGLNNSTTLGGYQAQQQASANLQNLALQSQAISDSANQAQTAATTNSGVLGQLAGFQTGISSMANQNAMTGFSNAGQTAEYNASAQNQASLANQQAQIQQNQIQSQFYGNLINSGLSAGALVATGGASGALTGLSNAISKGFSGQQSAPSAGTGSSGGLSGINTGIVQPSLYAPGYSTPDNFVG